jgi:hypothetical protein
MQAGDNILHPIEHFTIQLSQIEKIEYENSDPNKEAYTAYLGKRKHEDDYLYVYHHKNTKKICCFRFCHEPEDWIVIKKFHFYMIKKTFEQDQNMLQMKPTKNEKDI